MKGRLKGGEIMKKKYVKPEVEINVFEIEEITASSESVDASGCSACF